MIGGVLSILIVGGLFGVTVLAARVRQSADYECRRRRWRRPLDRLSSPLRKK